MPYSVDPCVCYARARYGIDRRYRVQYTAVCPALTQKIRIKESSPVFSTMQKQRTSPAPIGARGRAALGVPLALAPSVRRARRPGLGAPPHRVAARCRCRAGRGRSCVGVCRGGGATGVGSGARRAALSAEQDAVHVQAQLGADLVRFRVRVRVRVSDKVMVY